MSKIVVTARTRNEQAIIERFVLSYQWADRIVIADGGSTDKTKEIADKLPKTLVVDFKDKVYSPSGAWRNPHGKMLNYLFNIARNLDADWIVHDDVDCVPNTLLRESARPLIEICEKPVIMCHRMYVYGSSKWFPEMSKPGQSLWAWNVKRTNIRADESDPWKHVILGIPDESRQYRIDFPKALMHFFAPDEDTTKRKQSFYNLTGEIPNARHPLEFGGRLEPLPEWAILT